VQASGVLPDESAEGFDVPDATAATATAAALEADTLRRNKIFTAGVSVSCCLIMSLNWTGGLHHRSTTNIKVDQ
jgi:hypothetical protein